MSGPQTTNQTASAVNTAITDAAASLSAAVTAMIIVDIPALGLPGIRVLFVSLLNWLSGYFAKVLESNTTFLVIDKQIDDEKESLSAALKNLILAQKSNDPVKIKEALQNYANAHSALVHYDGSASPK